MKSPFVILTLALTLALPLMAVAQTQTVWRCGADGRSYADAPCNDGQTLAVASSRPAADVQSARERAAQEQKLADSLLKERLQREAAARNMPGLPVQTVALKPAAKPARLNPRKQTASAGIWRATVPGSRHKKG